MFMNEEAQRSGKMMLISAYFSHKDLEVFFLFYMIQYSRQILLQTELPLTIHTDPPLFTL